MAGHLVPLTAPSGEWLGAIQQADLLRYLVCPDLHGYRRFRAAAVGTALIVMTQVMGDN